MCEEQSELALSDAVLVAQAKAGSSDALVRLTARYYQPIRLFLLRRSGDRDLADDLTQETFLRALEHLADLRDDRCFRAWLYQIASRTHILYRRREERTSSVSLDHAVALPSSPAPAATDTRVQAILDVLPQRLRQVLVLHGLGDADVPEVAHRLGISTGAVYKNVSRAKKRFGELYAPPPSPNEKHDLL